MVDGVQQGPLINEKAIRKVSFLVKDAVDKGAKIIVGGESVPEVNIYKPTILVGVTSQMEIANTEIFGPVVAIQKFDDEDEVLKRANDTRFGLAGWLVTTNKISHEHCHYFQDTSFRRTCRKLHEPLVCFKLGCWELTKVIGFDQQRKRSYFRCYFLPRSSFRWR